MGFIGGSRGGVKGVRTPSFLSTTKSVAIACQLGTKALPRNNIRSKLSLSTYEVFSSSPTFSDTDLAQAIYMASRGSPKLLLALSVTSFIDSLYTVTALTCTQHAHLEFDHVYPQKNEHNMGMFGAHRRVGGGVQPIVTFPIGDHVNILHDYKKTRPSKIMKLRTCRCHHLIDMLVEFSQMTYF